MNLERVVFGFFIILSLTFNFVFLEGLFGFGPIAMPDFRATLIAEDLKNGPPASS